MKAAVPVVAATVAAIVAAAAWLVFHGGTPTAAPARWLAPQAPSTAAPELAEVNPFRQTAVTPTGMPTRLRVPSIGVDALIEDLRIGANGELSPPVDFARPGWYVEGTAPGDVGPAVIAGHVDSYRGPAIFYRLRELTAGDQIEVDRGGAIVRFTVTSTAWYPKSSFPTQEVYGPTPDSQLRLITCGGAFDRTARSYRNNLVVYAVAG